MAEQLYKFGPSKKTIENLSIITAVLNMTISVLKHTFEVF